MLFHSRIFVLLLSCDYEFILPSFLKFGLQKYKFFLSPKTLWVNFYKGR
jgi:hypothetical protein